MDLANRLLDVSVHLLADQQHLVEAIGDLRWREWGQPPEPTQREWWIGTTGREAGRDKLPVTWVAVDRSGAAVGAVGLGEFDIEERRDRSPWVLGMIVRVEDRGHGIGRCLLGELEQWASRHGYPKVWVATGPPAVGFYERCGWQLAETLDRGQWDAITVLVKAL